MRAKAIAKSVNRLTVQALATFVAAATAVLFLGMFAAAHAQADPAIDQAKAQGVVGEAYTGYLAIVQPGKASADLKRRVDEVNAKRLSIYTATAGDKGVPVQTVAALTGEKLIARAGAGEMVMPQGQSWTKK